MITGYLFRTSDAKPYVIAGDELRAPDGTSDYYRVYSNDGDAADLVYAIAGYRVEDVRAVTDEEIEELAGQDDAERDRDRAAFSAALDHIENVIGPWRAKGCTTVDGTMFESGVTTCVSHNRPGSAAGRCAVAEAIAFVDEHRPTE